MVTFGDDTTERPLCRTVKTDFLVLPIKSIYQRIIGRPTLGRLEAVPSTVHLKMRFYSNKGKVVTLLADLPSAKRTFYMGLNQREGLGVKRTDNPKKGGSEVNLTDLDARYDPENDVEEEDDLLT